MICVLYQQTADDGRRAAACVRCQSPVGALCALYERNCHSQSSPVRVRQAAFALVAFTPVAVPGPSYHAGSSPPPPAD